MLTHPRGKHTTTANEQNGSDRKALSADAICLARKQFNGALHNGLEDLLNLIRLQLEFTTGNAGLPIRD